MSQNKKSRDAKNMIALSLKCRGAIMTHRAKLMIRLIMGHSNSDICPLAYSINEAANLLFVQNIPWDEIKITKDIYPAVAKKLGKSPSATARSVERLVNRCWDKMTPQQKQQYIGRDLEDITSTTDFVVYMAYYLYYGKPYFEILHTQFFAL